MQPVFNQPVFNNGAASDPVFVDRSGRRRRLVRRLGVGFSVLCLAYGVALIALSLLGAHIDAPGLPFFRHDTATASQRAVPLDRTHRQSRTRAMPKPASAHRTSVSLAATPHAAHQPVPDTHASASEGRTKVVIASSARRQSSRQSSGQSSRQSSARFGATVSQGNGVRTRDQSQQTTHANQGKSATVPGATQRTAHTNHGKSATAPGATQRTAHTNQRKSATAPGRPTVVSQPGTTTAATADQPTHR